MHWPRTNWRLGNKVDESILENQEVRSPKGRFVIKTTCHKQNHPLSFLSICRRKESEERARERAGEGEGEREPFRLLPQRVSSVRLNNYSSFPIPDLPVGRTLGCRNRIKYMNQKQRKWSPGMASKPSAL